MYALIIGLVLIIAATVCGTVAFLTDHTDKVENTFTIGQITIDLTETEGVEGGVWQHQIVPGVTYPKNPIVSVEDTTTVDSWLFVKFEELNDAADYLIYESTLTSQNGWTKLDGGTNVWYRSVGDKDQTKSWHLLKDDQVTVKDTVTKTMVDTAANAKLVFTAYSIQKDGFAGAQKAWEEINKK